MLKIQHPIFEVTVPSSKQKLKYRPLLVKEEKILLVAQQSGNINDKIEALKQVVNNCILTENFDINKLMMFDIEYIFLKLRGNSINNIITISYKDKEDDKIYPFEINLEEVDVKFDENHTNKIKLSDTVTLVLKYPGLNIPENVINAGDENVAFMELIKTTLDKAYDGDELYDFNDFSNEEKEIFLDSLTLDNFNNIKKFFETMPKLYHKIEYKNSLGHARTITLETLEDFFTFR